MYMERHVLVGLGSAVMDTGLSLRGFLPGRREDVAGIDVRNFPPGQYPVRIGIGPPQSRTPDVALAIEGQGPWYPLGEIILRE
jgi:hypothetical protein